MGSNVKAYYRFESGALTTDTTGNGNTLTNNNSVASAAGLFGGCADGGATNTNKYFDIASNLGIAGNSDCTVACWIKMVTEISSAAYVFLQHLSTSGADRYINMYYEYNLGDRRIVCSFSGVSAFFPVSLGTSQWHHIAAVRDVAGTSGVIYVDGVAGTPITIGSGTTGLDRSSIMGASADSFISAYIDDSFFASYKATTAQINQLLSSTKPTFITSDLPWSN